ncbi:VC2046/SO_2500 family protein [Shewanella sp. H8]|uniref:VC2046/SO_2500 family protein n=1 Tax=Shewanella sp. H8 TaxID=3342676 RepID=UPI003315AAD9
MQIESTLVNELQIGNRLNAAIEHNRRGEFGLLLAMLSVDARDMAQFQFDNDVEITQKLRNKFSVPQPQLLVDDISVHPDTTDNATVFQQHGAKQFHLQQALTPEALVIRGSQPDSMIEVLNNCDYLTKNKAINAYQQHTPLEDMNFLDQLSTQRKISETISHQFA